MPSHNCRNETMQQLEFFEIKSPCISVCENNQRGYCKGCYRSREERIHWRQYLPVKRYHILTLCYQRKLKGDMYLLHSAPDSDSNLLQADLFELLS